MDAADDHEGNGTQRIVNEELHAVIFFPQIAEDFLAAGGRDEDPDDLFDHDFSQPRTRPTSCHTRRAVTTDS